MTAEGHGGEAMTDDRPVVCIHGGLRRHCETCDLADRLDVAEARVRDLVEALRTTEHDNVKWRAEAEAQRRHKFKRHEELMQRVATLEAEIARLREELTETRRARTGDSEIIGRWQCQADRAEADLAAAHQAITALGVQWRKEADYEAYKSAGGQIWALRQCADDLSALLLRLRPPPRRALDREDDEPAMCLDFSCPPSVRGVDSNAVESPKARILCDFEFHFTSGELLCVTAEEGRDTVLPSRAGSMFVVTLRPEPGIESVLYVDPTKLNAWQMTSRTVQPEVVTEDAGQIQLVGASV